MSKEKDTLCLLSIPPRASACVPMCVCVSLDRKVFWISVFISIHIPMWCRVLPNRNLNWNSLVIPRRPIEWLKISKDIYESKWCENCCNGEKGKKKYTATTTFAKATLVSIERRIITRPPNNTLISLSVLFFQRWVVYFCCCCRNRFVAPSTTTKFFNFARLFVLVWAKKWVPHYSIKMTMCVYICICVNIGFDVDIKPFPINHNWTSFLCAQPKFILKQCIFNKI